MTPTARRIAHAHNCLGPRAERRLARLRLRGARWRLVLRPLPSASGDPLREWLPRRPSLSAQLFRSGRTVRSPRYLLLAAVAMLTLSGCGGATKTVTETSPPTSSASASAGPTTVTSQNGVSTAATSAANSSPGAPLALGESASFVGEEIIGGGPNPPPQVSVTVRAVIDPLSDASFAGISAPQPAGQRYVAVQLKIQNTSGVAYSDSPSGELSLMSASTGGPVGDAAPGVTGPGQCVTDMSTVTVQPGATEHGCVIFEVPNGQQLASVQYETQGGAGGNLAAWKLAK